MAANPEGFTVGQVGSVSCSGTAIYKSAMLQKNAPVCLYKRYKNLNNEENVLVLQYQWFLESFTVVNNKIINFSARDIMAFTDNNYVVGINTNIETQFESARQTLINLTMANITIAIPNCNTKIPTQTGWSIRDLLSYSAIYNAWNYSCRVASKNNLFLEDRQSFLSINSDSYSEITIGENSRKIEKIRIARSDGDDPALYEGQHYSDYFIYYFGDGNNVLRLTCPIVDDDIRNNSAILNLLNKDIGCQFSCDNVIFDELFSPFCKIEFEGNNNTFYVSSANIKLAKNSYVMSVSGNSKSLSDYEYIGYTEKELRTKVALGLGYQHGFITQEDGIFWDDSLIQEWVNNG